MLLVRCAHLEHKVHEWKFVLHECMYMHDQHCIEVHELLDVLI